VVRLGRAGLLIATAVGAALVVLALLLSDPWEVAARLSAANPYYVAAACLLDFASILFFALAWVAAAKAAGVEIGVLDGIAASILSLTADKLVASAAISGELVRLVYVKRKSRAGYAEFLATILVHRFLYNVAFVILLAVALLDMALRSALPRSVALVSVLAALSMALASYVLVRPESLGGLLRRVARYLDRLVAGVYAAQLGLEERADAFILSVARFVRSSWRRKHLMSLAVLLMLLQWVAGALELGALFRAVNSSADLWQLLVAFPLHCYLTALPVGIPAALGVTEAGTLAVLTALGVERSVAMAVTILVRFVEIWFELMLGAVTAALAGAELLSFRRALLEQVAVEVRVAEGARGAGGRG